MNTAHSYTIIGGPSLWKEEGLELHENLPQDLTDGLAKLIQAQVTDKLY